MNDPYGKPLRISYACLYFSSIPCVSFAVLARDSYCYGSPCIISFHTRSGLRGCGKSFGLIFQKTLTLCFSVILTSDMYVRHNDQTSAKNNYWLDIYTVQRLSLKHEFGRCGHGFGECDGLGGLSGFSRLGGSGEFDGLRGFGGFGGFGGFVF